MANVALRPPNASLSLTPYVWTSLPPGSLSYTYPSLRPALICATSLYHWSLPVQFSHGPYRLFLTFRADPVPPLLQILWHPTALRRISKFLTYVLCQEHQSCLMPPAPVLPPANWSHFPLYTQLLHASEVSEYGSLAQNLLPSLSHTTKLCLLLKI